MQWSIHNGSSRDRHEDSDIEFEEFATMDTTGNTTKGKDENLGRDCE